MRYLLRWAVILAVLGGAAYYGFEAFLGSASLRGRVAAHLREALGVPVTVGGLDVNLHDCAATDVVIYEPDAPTGATPFLTIARANINVGPSDWLAGKHPDLLILEGATVTFRHGRNDELLTKLPQPKAVGGGPIPKIDLRQSRVRLEREGSPDFVVGGVDATITTENSTIVLNGKANDPAWGGAWQVAGRVQPGGAALLDAQSASSVHVTPDVLTRVPFVQRSVWSHFTAEGDTPVLLRLKLDRPHEKVRYRVELAPVRTRVTIPSIQLTADQASGKVVVEDNLVSLNEVRGQIARGELHLRSADLDFRPPAGYAMRFDLDAKQLNLQDLPHSWNLPPNLGGRLSGVAQIALRSVRGTTVPSGTGDGRVEYARIGPIPFPNYSLKFQADQNGFRFEPRIGR